MNAREHLQLAAKDAGLSAALRLPVAPDDPAAPAHEPPHRIWAGSVGAPQWAPSMSASPLPRPEAHGAAHQTQWSGLPPDFTHPRGRSYYSASSAQRSFRVFKEEVRGWGSLRTILGQRSSGVESTFLQATIGYVFISIYHYSLYIAYN